ncbi:hypothetical protein [Chenggangzhangella methanolivorans]|uniref:Lipocalin-like domain-containing protein n=1 Tax=Chenggangzhangella methanolivorans TaxID=1437009 RepID=A0A9E6RI12_9HYPH|nr:hypothetical protein [Chenggangzhangella methanolivorans]QZO01387.1 hypothetical protein K6K41_07970 [Chenggangzhangella methanolivorans]
MRVLRPLGRALVIAAALAAAPGVHAQQGPRQKPTAKAPETKAPEPGSIKGFWKFGSTVIAVAEKPDPALGSCYVGMPVGASYVDFDDEGRLAIQFTSEMIAQRNGAPTELGKASFSGAALLRYGPNGEGRLEFVAKGAGFSGGAEHFFDSAFPVKDFSATLNGGLLNVQFKFAVDAFPGRCVFSVTGVYYKGVYR